METSPDTGALLNDWVAGLDAAEVVEARECLLAGTYSRKLLLSLRAALPVEAGERHGLDDPHLVMAGAPLSATVQTLLRSRLLRTRPEVRATWRSVDPVRRDRQTPSLFDHVSE